MSALDRAALIEAAAKARYERSTGHIWAGAPEQTRDCYRTECGNWLDAILPLIADAIEDPIRHGEAVHYEFCSLAQAGALVRSLLGDTDGDR